MYFQFFKCRRIFSFNSFIVFISVINLIILLIDKFITVMYFSARNSVERLQGVYFLINVILILILIDIYSILSTELRFVFQEIQVVFA